MPRFATEAEEAEWWDQHMDEAGGKLLEAMRDATVHRGGPVAILRERREKAAVSISLSKADIRRAQTRAAEKGVDVESYIADLVHRALQRAGGAARSFGRS